MLKLYKNTFKTVLAFFLIFSHFLVILSLFRGKTTLRAKNYCKLFSFQHDDPRKRRSSQRPQYSGKNVIWLPLKAHEQLSRPLIWTCL